jgi:2-polyprenyl-6-methoxyphenol hydroxylase-like FAD-dependent oxidoreductase
MVAVLLFARAGLRVTVFEKHAEFLRDFRGDTVHPSTLQVFHELGLLDRLLQRSHQQVRTLHARIAGQRLRVVDFGHLPVPAPFIALMPQWDFLDFVADAARQYEGFTLRLSSEVTEPLCDSGRVTGVRLASGEDVRARLVIAADGRHSRIRSHFDLPSRHIGAPMDVFWFRLPKTPGETNDSAGFFEAGRIFVLIDRGDYWQCAFVFPKGAADRIRNEGLDAFVRRILDVGPETATAREAIRTWDDVKLLTVAVNRLEQWHRPGILFIGDAAHAMSPIAGVGINLAIQDAVATANVLAAPMAHGADPDPLLPRVAARRMFPTRLTQRMQKAIQDRVIAPLLTENAHLEKPPMIVRLLDRIPLLRRIPGRLIGMGFRPEHVGSPEA